MRRPLLNTHLLELERSTPRVCLSDYKRTLSDLPFLFLPNPTVVDGDRPLLHLLRKDTGATSLLARRSLEVEQISSHVLRRIRHVILHPPGQYTNDSPC
jgi:hypothetical protein